MKNRLIFRILGALASALIIASVFIPFVSVTGYSQSLWETHSAVGTIYLPIMIIVFGVVGVLVFSTGFKTELAYASAGGLVFFLIMQTIPVIDQNLFNTMGVGYYCLVIGTVLIIVMAFICGLRVKQKTVKQEVVEETKEVSMIDQIDKLYNDQPSNQNLNESNDLDNIIQPLPVSPLSSEHLNNDINISSLPIENNIQPAMDLQNVEPMSEQKLETMTDEVAPIPEVVNHIDNSISSNQISNNVSEPINPVVSEFNIPVNNVVSNINASSEETLKQPVNPVMAEFSVNNEEVSLPQTDQNPVVAQFSNSESLNTTFISNNNSTAPNTTVEQVPTQEIATIEPIQPLGTEKKVDVMGETTSNSSNLDIFG